MASHPDVQRLEAREARTDPCAGPPGVVSSAHSGSDGGPAGDHQPAPEGERHRAEAAAGAGPPGRSKCGQSGDLRPPRPVKPGQSADPRPRAWPWAGLEPGGELVRAVRGVDRRRAGPCADPFASLRSLSPPGGLSVAPIPFGSGSEVLALQGVLSSAAIVALLPATAGAGRPCDARCYGSRNRKEFS